MPTLDDIRRARSTIAGHVHVGDYAILGGFTAVHQFCKIGIPLVVVSS